MKTAFRRLLAVFGRHREARAPLVAAALAIFLLVLVGSVALHNDTRTVRSEATLRLRNDADAAVRALERQGEDFARSVQVVADAPEVAAALRDPTPTSLAASAPLLMTLARGKQSPAAFLSSVTGVVRQVHPAQKELVGRGFAYRDWFQGASAFGETYVSTAYRSAARGGPLVVGVAAPVRDGSRQVGYVTALWQLQSVRAIVDGARRDSGVVITVTDQRGQPLTSELGGSVDDRGEPIAVAVSPIVRAALSGRPVSTEVDGSLVEAAPVPTLGWTVTATVPTATALAPAAEFRRSLLITLGLAVALVLASLGLGIRAARARVRERAEADAERRHLTTLFASSPIGIIEGMPDGRILAVNDAMAAMLGYEPVELLSMNATQLAHPESAELIGGALRQVTEGEIDRYATERVYLAKDGSPVPVLVSVVVLHDDEGSLARMVAFVVDQRRQRADADRLRELAAAVADREAFLTTLLDTIDVGVVATDADGRISRVNQFARRLHAVPGSSDPSDLTFVATDLVGVPLPTQGTLAPRSLGVGQLYTDEHLIVPADGGPPARVVSQTRRLTDADGTVIGAVTVTHDVTAVRQAEDALRASEARFRTVFDEGLTGKALVDAEGRITEVNAAFSRALGSPAEQLLGVPIVSLLAEETDRALATTIIESTDGALHREMRLASEADAPRWGLVSMTWITEHDGSPLLLTQLEDVTGRRVAEQRLTELALHDELTGLPNRRLLMERCTQVFAAARAGRGSTSVAVLFVDLDGFKAVNDRNGHDAGDSLLIDVAADLLSSVRPEDTVARVGGDEFVVILTADEGLEQVQELATRIGRVIRRQVESDPMPLTVSASIGIARVDLRAEPDMEPEQLLRRADAAMYQAKERGRDRHDVFDTELRDSTEARRVLEQGVRDGLDSDRLHLVFQPIIDLDRDLVVGAEALMRLHTEDGRLLPTLASIVAAEQAGLAEALSNRVLDLALTALRAWPEHMTVSVNISTRELDGKTFRDRVEGALRRHAVDPGRLVLEITETSMLRAGPSAIRELQRLRSRGVKVSIDDFGTGYATLQNLTVLPVDQLKVDASFTGAFPVDRTATAIVHGVISIAREMGVPCIVEGIETQAQRAGLLGLGVHGQGWLFGQPSDQWHVPEATDEPFLPL